MEIHNIENVTLAGGAVTMRVTITIEDDDEPPTVSVADAGADEGEEVTFTVTLSAESGKTVTVDVATSIESSDTAAARDFTASVDDADLHARRHVRRPSQWRRPRTPPTSPTRRGSR